MKTYSSREWLEALVKFDTTSRLSNLDLIHYIGDYLKSIDVQYWLSYNPEKTKANLFATLPASDGSTQGGIVLSGHTDVVPVTNQDWHTDPFTLTEKNGKLYGRGTCDMKGFIAVCLSMTPEFINTPRKKPLHLAFSFDEEVGCIGAPILLKELQQRGIKPDSCIVGEPTDMGVVVAHKGSNVYQCKVHGKAAHSSLTPEGCNAIEYAAELITVLRQLATELKTTGVQDTFFPVPFTTLSVNRIRGGIALNTIPEFCEFTYEFRNLPNVDANGIQSRIVDYVNNVLIPKMQAEHLETGIKIEKIATGPGLNTLEEAAIVQLVRALTNDHKIRKVAYGTEAGLFNDVGIPSIVCGPGSINNAHKANEFVDIEQLDLCEKFLRQLARSLN